MKSKVIAVAVLSVIFILAGCQYESQPTQSKSDLEVQSLSKKPPKGEKSELIIFAGDLAGSQEVLGCCPNAGPFPEYKMTLEEDPFPAEISGRELDGNIFMNKVGKRPNQSYMVQFWTSTMFLEVRGGAIDNDKKNKILTATFTDASCEIDGNTILVSFILTRTRQ